MPSTTYTTRRSEARARAAALALCAGLLLALPACDEPVSESLAQASSAAAQPPVAVDRESAAPQVSEELQAPVFQSDAEGPKLHAIEGTQDFGSVYAGAQLDHTFQLEVLGTEDLVINRIKPSCGCTVATSEVIEADGTRRPLVLEERLPVGTRIEVACRFDTTGKKGPQVRPVNVYCSDPRGVERLILKADLKEFVTSSPGMLQLGRFSVIESKSAKFMMRTTTAEPVKLSVDSLRIPEELSVVLEPEEPTADGRAAAWLVEVTLGGTTLRPGPYQFLIPIDSDVPNPNAPEDPRPDQRWLGGSILVTADVFDVYYASTKQLLFGSIQSDTAVSRGFAFSSFDDEFPLDELSIDIVGLDGGPLPNRERYQTRVEPGNGPRTWRIELLIDGLPLEAARFEGLLQIATNNPERPTIDIPFLGVVR